MITLGLYDHKKYPPVNKRKAHEMYVRPQFIHQLK